MSSVPAPKLANPAVVGLAGFGLTTLMLQIHNLGFAGVGPVVVLGFIFGGLAQMIAGFQEQKTGNLFGYAAFTAYGAFWISLGLVFISNRYNIFPVSKTDLGWYLVLWTLFTVILWVAALRIHGAMAFTFTTLVIGFVLLDIGHFGYPVCNTIAAYVLIVCALSAWYMMAATLYADVFGSPVLPVGKAWVVQKAPGQPNIAPASATA